MSDRDNATHTRKPKNEEEDPPPPYPGIPGADITSESAPLAPRHQGTHPLVTTQPATQPLVTTQPGSQPLVTTQQGTQPHVSQAGYHPQPLPSAPPEDTAPYSSAQSKEPPHLNTNPNQPSSYNPNYQYIPLSGQEPYRGSQAESYPIPPKQYSVEADYPRQQYPVPPSSGSYRPVETDGGTYYPTYVHPTATATATRRERRDGDCCEDCAVCLMFTAVCFECAQCIAECVSCLAHFK